MMSIERIAAPAPRVFYREYVAQDRPVILTDAVASWPARTSWSPEYFKEKFGHCKIKVEVLERDQPSDPVYFLTQKKMDDSMTMADYITKTQTMEPSGRFYMAQVPITKIIPELQNDIAAFPYPIVFPHRVGNGQGLFWMGPAGCTSALHFDPYHNFYVQFWGRKKWVIFPKAQQDLLYVPSKLQMRHFSPIDFEAPDLAQYPKYAAASPIELTLEPGETLFLPEGWVHYVETVEFAIALSFFWCTWARTLSNLPRDLRLVSGYYAKHMLLDIGRSIGKALHLAPVSKA